MIGYAVSLVRRTEPDILPAVGEDGPYLGVGKVEREIRFILEYNAFRCFYICRKGTGKIFYDKYLRRKKLV